VFSEIISIGGKNRQIGRGKNIGKESDGPGKRDLAFWGHFSWPLD
jgi:hypothetical protein